jgi:hypothetical protein
MTKMKYFIYQTKGAISISSGIKITYQEMVSYMNNNHLYVLSDKFDGANSKVDFYDDEGYYYSCVFANIKNNQGMRKVHKSNPYSIQNIKLWLRLNKKTFILLSNKYEGNNKQLLFQCTNVNCKEKFYNTWNDIQQKQNCPYCTGRRVGISNCLATVKPDLAKEWCYSKNGTLTPYEVTKMSNTSVYWECAHNHIWKAQISNRSKGRNCPYCNNRLASNINNVTKNEILAKEWDYSKNTRHPKQYTLNSHQKVWWKCSKCGCEWMATIKNRNSNQSGCPRCHQSKGEDKILEWLLKNNISYIPQKEFKDLIGLGKGNLSYDFYLPKYNLLIEYQGEFHDGSAGKYSRTNIKKQQEHDRRKKQYTKDNNIKLLEIWYWDYDNIEKILEKIIYGYRRK